MKLKNKNRFPIIILPDGTQVNPGDYYETKEKGKINSLKSSGFEEVKQKKKESEK